jgi:hypothetical protein
MRCFIFVPGKLSGWNFVASCKGNKVSDMTMYVNVVSSYSVYRYYTRTRHDTILSVAHLLKDISKESYHIVAH